jgi:hypothetical protein
MSDGSVFIPSDPGGEPERRQVPLCECVLPVVGQIHATGPTTTRVIAEVRNARGGAWCSSTERNLLARQVVG